MLTNSKLIRKLTKNTKIILISNEASTSLQTFEIKCFNLKVMHLTQSQSGIFLIGYVLLYQTKIYEYSLLGDFLELQIR